MAKKAGTPAAELDTQVRNTLLAVAERLIGIAEKIRRDPLTAREELVAVAKVLIRTAK